MGVNHSSPPSLVPTSYSTQFYVVHRCVSHRIRAQTYQQMLRVGRGRGARTRARLRNTVLHLSERDGVHPVLVLAGEGLDATYAQVVAVRVCAVEFGHKEVRDRAVPWGLAGGSKAPSAGGTRRWMFMRVISSGTWCGDCTDGA